MYDNSMAINYNHVLLDNLVTGLEETDVQKDGSSNPSTGYQMDRFHIYLLSNCIDVWKYGTWMNNRPGWPIFE